MDLETEKQKVIAMNAISRRNFLKKSGLGAATAGIAATVPTWLVATPSAATEINLSPDKILSKQAAKSNAPLVVHIPDPSSGQIHFMIGTHEVVEHDPALVSRLLNSAR